MEETEPVRVPMELLDEISTREGWAPIRFYAALLELESRGVLAIAEPDLTPLDPVLEATAMLGRVRERLGGATLAELNPQLTPEEREADEAAERLALAVGQEPEAP